MCSGPLDICVHQCACTFINEGYPDFFKFVAIVNRTAVQNCILVCIWIEFEFFNSEQLNLNFRATASFEFQSNCLNTESMIAGSQSDTWWALGKTARLSLMGAAQAPQQQWEMVPLVPHPPATSIILYLEFSSPKRCGVIYHNFNL